MKILPLRCTVFLLYATLDSISHTCLSPGPWDARFNPTPTQRTVCDHHHWCQDLDSLASPTFLVSDASNMWQDMGQSFSIHCQRGQAISAWCQIWDKRWERADNFLVYSSPSWTSGTWCFCTDCSGIACVSKCASVFPYEAMASFKIH